MAKSNSPLQSGLKIEQELDALLQQLEIREDEDQEIVLEEDLEDLKGGARWTALAKVHSLKTFSHSAFLANMKYAWSLAKDVSFKAIEENLFVFQFTCLGDWQKVMNEGPWFFRGNVVMLKEYDGITKPSTVNFKKLAMWVRIYDLPTAFRTENIGRQLGNKIGETLWVEPDDDTKGWRDYLRIRINLDIEKPLTRVVYISKGKGEGRDVFRVKYEKLPKFCAVCGLLGHVESECGDGVHENKSIKYGEWLIASPEKKWKVKGNKSFGSADTKGSDSRESTKGLIPLRCGETRSRENNQKDQITDDADLQDDARSTMRKGRDQQPKFDGSGACKRLTPGNGEVQHDVQNAMSLIPIFSPMEQLEDNSKESEGMLKQLSADGSELENNGNFIGRGSKRLRVAVENVTTNDIEMRSAGSFQEYRREK